MSFDDFNQEQHFRSAWDSVSIDRSVSYDLFTFGDSELPYYLVTAADGEHNLVKIQRGQVNITRPRLITPDTMAPEFRNFFEEQEDDRFIQFLMARTAAFGNLKFTNQSGPERIVTDTVDEAIARLNKQLDDEDEDRVAILSAPAPLGGMAVLRYASERVWSSAPGNIQDLRERGFLS